MAKDPAFLFYASDFLTGVMFMTNEQIGIYIQLLCSQHQHGGIIDKVSFEAMVSEHKILKSKFVETEEGYYNERLMFEMEKRNKKSNNISEAVKKVWGERIAKGLHKDSMGLHKNRKRKSNKNDGIPLRPEDVNEDEIVNYFVDNKYSIESAKKFFQYYSVAGWKDSNGNKVLNWKQKAQSVWFKPENEIKEQKPKQEETIPRRLNKW
jgi:uncharacterized protein YdaU (DUF1376 family)